jgi:hypothetical protein
MKILSAFLSAIINDDTSGLTEGEIKTVQNFVDNYPACIFNTADIEPFFNKCELTNLAGNCGELIITRPHFKKRYVNSRRGSVVETESELDNLHFTSKGFNAELKRLVSEYQLSDRSAHYYISNRGTAAWRTK